MPPVRSALRRGAGHCKPRAGAAGGKNRPALAGGVHRPSPWTWRSRRMTRQAFDLHEKLVAPRISSGRMDDGSRVVDWDRCFSRTDRRRGRRGVLERPPVTGPAGPARASGTPLPGHLAVRACTPRRGNRRRGGRRDFYLTCCHGRPACHGHTAKPTRARPLPARPSSLLAPLRGCLSNHVPRAEARIPARV